jgi:hypothetical protein
MPGPRRRDLLDRFFEKVTVNSGGCWLWRGPVHRNGYASFNLGGHQGKKVLAHRWAYENFIGPVPKQLDLDHLCRVRHCVNPEHLEAVTRRVNLLRGETIPAAHAHKTYCINGHEFTKTNTYRKANGTRQCRACCFARVYKRRKEKTNGTMA